jgi:hypothetical protein
VFFLPRFSGERKLERWSVKRVKDVVPKRFRQDVVIRFDLDTIGNFFSSQNVVDSLRAYYDRS